MRLQLGQRRKPLLVTYLFTQYYIDMATVEVHYNVQQMYFELLTHARNRRTGANIGDARYRFVTQPCHFYRIDPFNRGNLTTQR